MIIHKILRSLPLLNSRNLNAAKKTISTIMNLSL